MAARALDHDREVGSGRIHVVRETENPGTSVSSAPIRDDSGRSWHGSVIYDDVTEGKEHELAAREQSRINENLARIRRSSAPT